MIDEPRHPSPVPPETAQEQQDQVLARIAAAPPTPQQVAELKAYLGQAGSPSTRNPSSPDYDPIAVAMAEHPKLTRDSAERMASEFGF